MKWVLTHRFSFIISVIALSQGCSSDSVQPTSNSLPPGSYYYRFAAKNLQAIDSARGHYVLWVRFTGDSIDQVDVQLAEPTYSNDSLVFSGIVKLTKSLDSILSEVVSIKQPTLAITPSSALMTGQFQSDSGYSFLSASNSGGVGDYSNVLGSVIFTTKSSDTNRAKSEFYLMSFMNGVPVSSISNLPKAPTGWRYGLWVLDSNFFPIHKFFYGSFVNPNGPGSDSTRAEFPFPGGYNPAPLTDAGAILEVTLEADFSVSGNSPSVPSPIAILWLQLRQFINFDQSISFKNVWSTSAPTGTLRIWR